MKLTQQEYRKVEQQLEVIKKAVAIIQEIAIERKAVLVHMTYVSSGIAKNDITVDKVQCAIGSNKHIIHCINDFLDTYDIPYTAKSDNL